MKPTRRFRAMPQSTEQQPARKSPMSPKVGRDIVAKLRPGKWYSAKSVAENAGITERDVHSVLRAMCWRPAHGAKAERKKVGTQIHYRIFKQDKKVSAVSRPRAERTWRPWFQPKSPCLPRGLSVSSTNGPSDRRAGSWDTAKAIHTYVPRSTLNVPSC
jgi:hypothetical protein